MLFQALESATTGNNNFSNSSPVTEDEDWETLISRLDSDHRSSHQHHHHHQSESEYFCSNPGIYFIKTLMNLCGHWLLPPSGRER